MPEVWTGAGFEWVEPWEFTYEIREVDGVRGLALVRWGEHLPLREAMRRLRIENPECEWKTTAIHGTTIRYIASRPVREVA